MSYRVANHLILQIHLNMYGPVQEEVDIYLNVLIDEIRQTLPLQGLINSAHALADQLESRLANQACRRMLDGRNWIMSPKYLNKLIRQEMPRLLRRFKVEYLGEEHPEAPPSAANPGMYWPLLLRDLFVLSNQDLTLEYLYNLRDNASAWKGRLARLRGCSEASLSTNRSGHGKSLEQLVEALKKNRNNSLKGLLFELIQRITLATQTIAHSTGPSSKDYADCVPDILIAVDDVCKEWAHNSNATAYQDLFLALDRVVKHLVPNSKMVRDAVEKLETERLSPGDVLNPKSINKSAIVEVLAKLPSGHKKKCTDYKQVLENIAVFPVPSGPVKPVNAVQTTGSDQKEDQPESEELEEADEDAPLPASYPCIGILQELLRKTVNQSSPLFNLFTQLTLGYHWKDISLQFKTIGSVGSLGVTTDQVVWARKVVECVWQHSTRSGEWTELELPPSMSALTAVDKAQMRSRVLSALSGETLTYATWNDDDVCWALMIGLADELIEAGQGRLYRTRYQLRHTGPRGKGQFGLLKHGRETLEQYLTRKKENLVTVVENYAPHYQCNQYQRDGCTYRAEQVEEVGESEDDD